VRELPSLKHIKSLRTVLSIVTKTLAAYQLSHARNWKQLHTDETLRCQVSIVNVVISIINSDNELCTICRSGPIISKDGTADEQSRAIISAFNDSGRLLQEWRDMTSALYPGEDKLLAAIPNRDDMSPMKLIGGFLSHNNCATANKTYGRISIDSAAGIGQARYNKDLDCNHGCFITRGKGRGTRTDQSAETGAFHTLPEKLQDSLMAVAKKNGNRSRRQFTASLRRQREACAAKAANAIAMKLQSTEKDLINISYLYSKLFLTTLLEDCSPCIG
jgi:hypothetical protein